MVNFNLDDCLRFVNNKYELILLASARALEILNNDSQPLIQKGANEKSFFTALREIEHGLLDYSTLNNKFMTNIKNNMVGILVNSNDTMEKEKERFDETSIFAKIFQNLNSDNESFDSVKNDIFDEIIESSDKIVNDEDDSFASDINRLDRRSTHIDDK